MKTTLSALTVILSTFALSAIGIASAVEQSASATEARSACIHASLNGLELKFSPTLQYVTDDNGQPVWELAGSSNRDLDDFFTFICDDAYATPTMIDSKHFTVRFNPQETRAMLMGMPIFGSAHVTGDSRSFYTAIWLRPELSNFSGSSRIWAEPKMRAIFYGGQDWYQGNLSTSIHNAPNLSVDTSADGGAFVQQTGSESFSFSFTYENLISAATMPGGDQVTFTVVDGAQKVTRKHADITVNVAKVETTADDPYAIWPVPMELDPSVQSCLDELPFGSYDASSCGSFREVRQCKIKNIIPLRRYATVDGDYMTMIQKANAALGPKTQVIAFGGGYSWASYNAPTMDQLLEMLIQSERIPYATRAGEISRSQAEEAMQRVGLDGLITHLCQQNHEVGCDANDTTVRSSMRFGLLKLSAPYAMPFSTGSATVVLLVFPNTGKYLAVEVAEQN